MGISNASRSVQQYNYRNARWPVGSRETRRFVTTFGFGRSETPCPYGEAIGVNFDPCFMRFEIFTVLQLTRLLMQGGQLNETEACGP
jgi:hypothetical protein